MRNALGGKEQKEKRLRHFAQKIEAREKPVHSKANDGKDHPPARDNPPPPRKDDERPKPGTTRLERQVTHNLGQRLAGLPTAYDVG
jgi:hypothetical protein